MRTNDQSEINSVMGNAVLQHNEEMCKMKDEMKIMRSLLFNLQQELNLIKTKSSDDQCPNQPDTGKQVESSRQGLPSVAKSIMSSQDNNAKKKETSLNCKFCSHRGKTEKAFQKHMNTKHSELKSCDICADKFKTSEELCAHKLSMHKNSVTVHNKVIDGQNCPMCGYKFKTEINMISHMLSEHNFKVCHKCKTTFSDIEKLKEHLEKDHEDLEEMTPEERVIEDQLNQLISDM